MNFLRIVFFVFLITTAAVVIAACNPVASSHIEGNVPAGTDFDQFLKRDLEDYFSDSMGKDVIVNYELLRKGPTQSGVAFPKYYAWVKVYEGTTLLEEGAVRVAAVDKSEFHITNYLSKDDIENDPESIYSVFPAALGDKIEENFK